MLFKEGANCVSQLRVTRVQKIVNAEDTFNSQQSVSQFQVAPDIFALMVTVHMDPIGTSERGCSRGSRPTRATTSV